MLTLGDLLIAQHQTAAVAEPRIRPQVLHGAAVSGSSTHEPWKLGSSFVQPTARASNAMCNSKALLAEVELCQICSFAATFASL